MLGTGKDIFVGGFQSIFIKPTVTPTIIRKEMSSFEECLRAGYPVLQTFPRQCRNQNGEVFVEDIPTVTPYLTPTVFYCG